MILDNSWLALSSPPIFVFFRMMMMMMNETAEVRNSLVLPSSFGAVRRHARDARAKTYQPDLRPPGPIGDT